MASIRIEIDLHEHDEVDLRREWFWSPSAKDASRALDEMVLKAKRAAGLPETVEDE